MAGQAEQIAHKSILNILSGRIPVDISELEQAHKSTFESDLLEVLKQINEAHEFFLSLAAGNLDYSAPRYNALAGPAKDLQATLRHLLWQVERVALGDFDQKVEFLGDFSKGFNIYIEQVSLREDFEKKSLSLEKENLEQKNRVLAKQLEQQLNHYENLKQIYQNISGIKHDLKNHFFAMDNLLSHNDIKGAHQYLNSFMPAIINTRETTTVYDTHNPIFDALLTEKAGIAMQNKIEMEAELALSPNINIESVDWCILLGNALDNAIEACQCLDSNDKKITVKAVSRKNLINISIKNTALPPVKHTDGFYITSKKDKLNHGLGLKNISEVVEKYDGAIQTEYEEGYFTLTCMLCGV